MANLDHSIPLVWGRPPLASARTQDDGLDTDTAAAGDRPAAPESR